MDNWWDYGFRPYALTGYEKSSVGPKDQYIEDLKSMSGYFGCRPEEIDALLEDGFSPEELEEFLCMGYL